MPVLSHFFYNAVNFDTAGVLTSIIIISYIGTKPQICERSVTQMDLQM